MATLANARNSRLYRWAGRRVTFVSGQSDPIRTTRSIPYSCGVQTGVQHCKCPRLWKSLTVGDALCGLHRDGSVVFGCDWRSRRHSAINRQEWGRTE